MKAVIDNHKISVQNKKDRLVKSQEELEHLTHQWDNRPEIPSTGQLDQERVRIFFLYRILWDGKSLIV